MWSCDPIPLDKKYLSNIRRTYNKLEEILLLQSISCSMSYTSQSVHLPNKHAFTVNTSHWATPDMSDMSLFMTLSLQLCPWRLICRKKWLKWPINNYDNCISQPKACHIKELRVENKQTNKQMNKQTKHAGHGHHYLKTDKCFRLIF